MKIIARPWTPQDLLDDLQELIDEEPDNYLNTRRTTLATALSYLKEHFAEEEHRWISVADRLPDPFELVYVYDNKDKRITDAYLTRHLEWVGVRMNNEVTHWMPMPEPPRPIKDDGTKTESGLLEEE